MPSELSGTDRDHRGNAPFMCSFCLRPRQETGVLAAAPTAAICRDCAEGALKLLEAPRPADPDPLPATPWEALSNDELLERLPRVAQARDQVEEHLRRWVTAARDRNISWAVIGASLGMSRQSAWERFRTTP
ncbi:ClpX C4-type zinc finger protein [Arthrobacter sp. zg-Y238]|uniref:ClpX C4-type zinc finger protein n=1 Tax=Arthrobacter sp. zg-Y238 TaxID=2964614 RepID=UPI0021068AD0|nr:ClpX C4-type zinc finger protein [Arthrobacter sp. zg-Y238]MCQ1953756.1 ClpX C4-type zinc finger protein [Arthrobacter sp. zg-Y238]